MAGGENARAALDYAKHYRSARMIGSDSDYSMMGAYQCRGWPQFVVIDPEGVIQFHGPPDDRKLTALRKRLNELVPEQAAPGDGTVLKDGICYPKSVVKARAARRDRSPRLAVDGNGNPRMVFYSNRDGSNSIYLRSVKEGGGFTDERITPTGADCYAPDCVVDSEGVLWVVWCGKQGEMYDIYAWSRGPDSPPATTRLTRSAEDAMRPRIAAGADGAVAVTYYRWRSMRGVSRDRDIFCRLYDPQTEAWGDEVEVSPHDPEVEDHTDPDVVVDGDGAVWVAWSYDYHPQLFSDPVDADQPTVFASKVADGVAGAPLLVGTVGESAHAVDLFPTLALEHDGTLWCAYDAYEWRGGGRTVRLGHRDGGKFQHAANLRMGQTLCSTPELAPARDGGLVVAWSECLFGTWQGVVALVRNGRIVAETPIDGRPADVLFPQAMQDRDGRVWVVYEKCDGDGSEIVLRELTNALAVR